MTDYTLSTDVPEQTEMPLPLEEKNNSNTLVYVIVGVGILVVICIASFVIIRCYKKKSSSMKSSPRTSTANSIMSGTDMHENV